MTKRSAMMKILTYVLGLAALIAGGAARAADRPNIVFIFSDDHAYQAVSAYGGPLANIAPTPHIDRLAREGMLFDRCFVCNSLCGPSRATVLTGLYSHKNGFYSNGGDVFDGSQTTFPKLLQKVGYQTAIVGKWHLVSAPQGFNYWNILYGQGQYYNPPMNRMGQRVKYTGYTSEILADLALDWLEKQRDPAKPFVLMYQNKAPHRRWEPSLKYLHLFDDVTIPEPNTLFDDYAGRGKAEKTQDMTIAKTMDAQDLKLKTPPDLNDAQREQWEAAYAPKNASFEQANLTGRDLVRWKYQRYMKDYLRCIRSVDDGVGRILDYLDRTGLASNTIVVYTSDQGFYLGEHGWFDKRWIFKESLRTPLIVRWPGVVKPGARNRRDIVSNLDFAETFCEAAGVPVPSGMQGRSLVPVLQGHTPEDWRKDYYYHYYEWPAVHNVRPHYGVASDHYKLVKFYGDVDYWELFDLQKDPAEMTSVYEDPSYAETRKQLRAELERLQQRLGDTNPEVPLKELRRQAILKTRSLKVMPLQKVLQVDQPGRPLPGIDPSLKPFTVGATCTPSAPDGVLMADGGASEGFSLYLKEGRPRFAIRSGDELFQVIGPDALKLNQAVNVVGMLAPDSTLRLFVDGKPAGKARGLPISRKPFDGLSLGQDSGSFVGDYDTPLTFKGDLSDFRIYWGTLDEAAIRQWAQRR
jgi:arylsulfatase A-like enzyme